ncbi:MAG: tetraacyldisaccharide 4'-kinase, partial [Methylococcaceae bacterium]|nr:tetraacyldisaccharide 4'-kinase [Methylococcaceae bacterium]
LLADAGLRCTTHSFPDHHAFTAADITFKDDKAVLMTEKDAVKCRALAGKQHGFVPVTAVLPTDFAEQLLNLLKRKA